MVWVDVAELALPVPEGMHVMLGLALVPVVLTKLWSVSPSRSSGRRGGGRVAARATDLALVVGGVICEMTTGILNIEYTNPISFYTGHFYGAWGSWPASRSTSA
jgi:hypothetical protein